MCGIAGVFLAGAGDAGSRFDVIAAMTDTMVHRGPDASGHFTNECVALGHRRLSIIDLSDNAAQPMFNEDGTLVLLFNGEIYNFGKLRTELERRGHRFRSRSDGEVILHLYEEYGTSCAEHLEGMFAFSVYDVRAETLYLARDRVGEKPLYYATAGDGFYFSSEIKGLLATGVFPKRLNRAGIDAFFNFVQIPAPATIFDGISKLQPGHWLLIDRRGSRTVKPYWRVDFTHKLDVPIGEAVDRLHGILTEAVGQMLVSDVPLGVLLSGGVDSSLILAIAHEIGATDIQTFTVANLNLDGEGDDDDLRRAKQVVRRFGTRHHVFNFGDARFEDLQDAAAACDEPIGISSIFYLFGVFNKVKGHARVLLTGNGADELFAGYVTYNPINRLSSAFRHATPILSRVNKSINRLASSYYVHRNGRILRSYFAGARDEWSAGSARLLQDAMDVASYGNLLDAKLFADLCVLCNHALTSIPDTGGMVNSIEVRSPYLHPRVIEFAASLPSHLKVGDTSNPAQNKRLLRLLLSRYMDDDFVYGPKYGFGYFINSVATLATRWKNEVEALIFDDALRDLELFDFDSIRTIWARCLRDDLDVRERLLLDRYVMFAAWYKHSFLRA